MDLEKAIYESLPLAYIGAGLMTLLLLESPLKFLPALALISAGLLVLAWRNSARNSAQRLRVNSKKVRSIPGLNG